jgi:uncharacterized protein (DUF302 family)
LDSLAQIHREIAGRNQFELEANTVSEDGLVTMASNHTVSQTLDRLENALKSKDITVFARIDHAAGAASVAMPLRPTELLIFGNPKGGTPLMQSNQTVGIDLPLKILGWQDAGGQTWLTFNDPVWFARRHQLSPTTDANVGALKILLETLTKAAAE